MFKLEKTAKEDNKISQPPLINNIAERSVLGSGRDWQRLGGVRGTMKFGEDEPTFWGFS